MDAEIVGRTLVHRRWSTISEVELRLPNGVVEDRLVEDHGSAAAVLLYDPDRRVALLVRQPRAPVIEVGGADVLEIVAGRMEGKSGEETARAEAWEEAGVHLGAVERVATMWMMPAVSTERLELFLAAYSPADRTGEGGGAADENECIRLEEMPLADLAALMTAGGLVDGKTLVAVQALMLRRPELFTAS